MSNSKYFRILSIDGGGIRGIIPAMILKHIEEQTNKKISHLFDLIAGTSTGGILALGLTMPKLNPDPSESGSDQPEHTAENLVKLYWDKGKDIFDQSRLRWIWSLGGTREEMYSSRGIEGVLKKSFKETYLSEAIKPVLIPSYDMRGTRRYWKAREEALAKKEKPPKSIGGHPRFFKSEAAKKDTGENYLMRDVARATSAAPTYFEPHDTQFKLDKNRILDDDERFETLVDGGIFANNPAMCAYAEAKRLDREQEGKLIGGRDVLLVSLGTGELTKKLKYNEARDWGKVEWILKDETLLKIIFDGASDAVHYQLDQLLDQKDERGKKLYYRFQAPLTQGLDKMDDATLTNLTSLETIANDLITNKNEDLGNLRDQLQETQS